MNLKVMLLVDVSHKRKIIREYDWNKEVVDLVVWDTEDEIRDYA